MPRERSYVLDMLEAARDAEEFSSGLTFEEFQLSRLHQHAIIKAIENVGEAATHIAEDVKAAHPEIPWRKMIGMRHRMVHAYSELVLEVVWETVTEDIPHLIGQLERVAPDAARRR